MVKSTNKPNLFKRILQVIVELLIITLVFFILNGITTLSIHLIFNSSSDNLFVLILLILGIPILLILKIYLSNLFGCNYALNSKLGKTFIIIVIILLVLDIALNTYVDITQVRIFSELASHSVEENIKVIGEIEYFKYYQKILSGETMGLSHIVAYLIWQIAGLIAFSKGALGVYKEKENEKA